LGSASKPVDRLVEIVRHSATSAVGPRKIVHRGTEVMIGGDLVPIDRLFHVLGNSSAIGESNSEVMLCVWNAVVGGFLAPFHKLVHIVRDTESRVRHSRQIVLEKPFSTFGAHPNIPGKTVDISGFDLSAPIVVLEHIGNGFQESRRAVGRRLSEAPQDQERSAHDKEQGRSAQSQKSIVVTHEGQNLSLDCNVQQQIP